MKEEHVNIKDNLRHKLIHLDKYDGLHRLMTMLPCIFLLFACPISSIDDTVENILSPSNSIAYTIDDDDIIDDILLDNILNIIHNLQPNTYLFKKSVQSRKNVLQFMWLCQKGPRTNGIQ